MERGKTDLRSSERMDELPGYIDRAPFNHSNPEKWNRKQNEAIARRNLEEPENAKIVGDVETPEQLRSDYLVPDFEEFQEYNLEPKIYNATESGIGKASQAVTILDVNDSKVLHLAVTQLPQPQPR